MGFVCIKTSHGSLEWLPIEGTSKASDLWLHSPVHLCTSAPCLKWQCSTGALRLPVHDGLIMGFRALLLLSKHFRDPCPSEERAFYSLEASKADYAIQGRYQMKLSSRSRDP